MNDRGGAGRKGQHRKINEAVQATVEVVSQRLARATARSTSSVFAESIPYVGITAIIGVTGLEIYNACETMKDLTA